MYRATTLLGDPQWFGWTATTTKAADTADMALLTAKAAAVNPHARLTTKDRTPRPTTRSRACQPSSLLESFASFLS